MDNTQKEGLHLNSHTKMPGGFYAIYNKPWSCKTCMQSFTLKMSWFPQVTKQFEEPIALKPASHDFIKNT